MLTRWSDFDRTLSMLDELRRRMDRIWDEYDSDGQSATFEDRSGRTFFPRTNLFDDGANLVLQAELPGVREKDLQLTINQEVLTLRGERKTDVPEGYSVHRQERSPVKFARSFTLPAKIDSEKATASLKNGVLTIALPKTAEAQPKRIAVRTQ